MKITKLAVALLVALGTAGAQAATYNIGTLGPTAAVGTNTVAGSFSDILNFSITSPYALAAGAVMDVPLSFTMPGGSTLTLADITGLTASLYNGFNAGGSMISTQGPNDYLSMSGVLDPGSYSLKIAGTGTGMGGAGYYTYTAFAQAVPEPESYAMFLAGLGLLGAAARRRKG